MITELNISNFKSLRDVKLKLGPLNLFIGANASGKSNFFDALRVLQGIGNGYTFAEILDGKPKSQTNEAWNGIRGGSAKAVFMYDRYWCIGFKVTYKEPLANSTRSTARCLSIEFNPRSLELVAESFALTKSVGLSLGGYSTDVVRIRSDDPLKTHVAYGLLGCKGKKPHISFESNKPIISQFAENTDLVRKEDAANARLFCSRLANIQRIDPVPSILRQYSQAQRVKRIGENGENFAALVRSICEDQNAKNAYVSWLNHLRPSEIEDVEVVSGAVGEPMFAITERKNVFHAPVLSDGTLRFAAITAAMLQPDMPGIMTIEEIENGIHASRLRLLVELLHNVTTQGKTQVFATTHSPTIISWLKEEDYPHTFFCKRNEETSETRIVPLSEIPNFLEIVKHQSAGDLFAEGWMENAL